MQDFPVYLINLDGSDGRLAAAAEALAAQGTGFTRIPAFDGRGIDPTRYPDYDGAAMRGYMGRDMTGGEIGCYISHLRALEALVQSDAPFGLVLEDDMQPQPNAIRHLCAFLDWQAAQGAPDWHVAHLAQHRLKITTRLARLDTKQGPLEVLRAHYFPVLAHALLWTRQGARDFLRIAPPLRAPYDNELRRWLTANDRGLALRPGLFTTTGAESDIEKASRSQRRATEGRLPSYGWLRQKRLMADKARAYLHKMQRRIGNTP